MHFGCYIIFDSFLKKNQTISINLLTSIHMIRRKFLQASLIAAPLAVSTSLSVTASPERGNKAFKVNAGEGRFHGHIQLQGLNRNFLDLKVSGKDTSGDLAIFQSTTRTAKSGPPMHVHPHQDEIF